MHQHQLSCSTDPLDIAVAVHSINESKQYTDISTSSQNQLNIPQYPNVGKRSAGERSTESCHSFNEDLHTRNKCIAALVLGAILCIACFILSIVILAQRQNKSYFYPNNLLYKIDLPMSSVDWAVEIILLVVNFGVTLCLETLSYIHAVSLRWALYREGRLEFNTNLRLFTASRRSAPNQWYTNVLSAACLILSYASTSLLFIKNSPYTFDNFGPDMTSDMLQSNVAFANSIAICCLGVGLLGHVSIAIWCIWSSSYYIPTWSSNPLNNTLGMLKDNIQHRLGRCMMSASEKSVDATPRKPCIQQTGFNKVSPSAGRLTIFVWVIALLAAAWSIAMAFVCRIYVKGGGGFWTSWKDTLSWSMNTYENLNTYIIFMNPADSFGSPFFSLGWQLFCAILFLCAVQGLQTLGLHCAELIVNATRDEKAWRRTNPLPFRPIFLQRLKKDKKHGANLRINAFTSAINSWEYAILFILKPVLHWFMGQSFSFTYDYAESSHDVYVNPGDAPTVVQSTPVKLAIVYSRLIIYTIMAIVLALFVTYLAFRKPSGPQPATWGHIQTLADLIDDWNLDENGCLWWGDKGVNAEGIRHAGTGTDKDSLEEIQMDAFYAGGR